MSSARFLKFCLSTVYSLILIAFPTVTRLSWSETKPAHNLPKVNSSIDDSNLVTLKGNTHPLANHKYDQGPVPDSLPLDHMFLLLKRSPEQQKALNQLAEDQLNPLSANYHKWLTAEELGTQYGPSARNLQTVTEWLTYHGFRVNQVLKTGMIIDVSGTAGQFRDAFHAEMHSFNVGGQRHIANANDPQIPAALSSIVAGFTSLNDFRPTPSIQKARPAFTFNCGNNCAPGFTGLNQYDETPADFATIYNMPIQNNGNDSGNNSGRGQTIAVLEDSDMQTADMTSFRAAFGLSSYNRGSFTQQHPNPSVGTATCTDPGLTANEWEAAPDAEWAYAVAPDANVELESCADTVTNPGEIIAATNLIEDHEGITPNIISLSYFECESALGVSGNAAISTLWLDASLQGISVFVAAGDGGAAGCDDYNSEDFATQGIAANGFGSTQYNVATGGTDFLDTFNNDNSTYWNATNTTSERSAKSYIPETPWNDSCAGSILVSYLGYANALQSCNSASNSGLLDIMAASGAPSSVYDKPGWQTAFGNPNDSMRDLPDVSLFASGGFWNHALVFCMSDANEGGSACNFTNVQDTFNNSGGGTSFTAPQLAGIQAIINEGTGNSLQGNVAPTYYSLYATQFGTSTSQTGSQRTNLTNCNSSKTGGPASSCIFYDVTSGSINVPCQGTANCYTGGNNYGMLSPAMTQSSQAYPAASGWDFATGLGSINITNLLNNWPGASIKVVHGRGKP